MNEVNPEGNPPGQRGPVHRRHWVLIGIAVALVVVLVLVIVRKPKSGSGDAVAQPQPANIRTATAHLGNMGLYVDALGTVTPVATVNIYSQVNGMVEAVHYTEGQMVRRGAPLIDIDARSYRAQLQEAQGTLQHDRALLAQAVMDLARYKEASGQQAIARQTYDDQVQAVEQYRGTVKNDEGQVAYAEVQLGYCHITAPISGRIGLRLVDPGNVMFSGGSMSIAVITQLQPITVVFNVAEDNLEQVHDEILQRASLPVDIFDRSQQTKIATGKLLTLDNQIDTSTGTVRFRGQFDNTRLNLYPNQFVNARLLVRTLTNVVLVPTAAVQRNGTQAFVYVVSGNAVKMRNVTELSTENDVAAVSGVIEGDVVSVTGFDKLQDGSKVTVQQAAAPDPAASATANVGAGMKPGSAS
ncbi:efflux RND transporter periplasmic adaptor subunit [Caballeronia sordidicola]|uniref:Putative Co/Zn/Cd efflux system membrane fusion protein n=1 Tax=Caballeronia sordidicola TaxID=196367 RepID=A0A242M682_CABSO|nr:efflux RND transporter periplasmic adaptor subunit [Caballeronia sordidicola]OTP66602.1 putative Co/Zn/Cd efflux system membrane fusion protein [Caballeronia sordidicola]